MKLILAALTVSLLMACTEESNPPETTTTTMPPVTTTLPPPPPPTTTMPPAPVMGTWVIIDDDFGPCNPTPVGSCKVGDKVSAKGVGLDYGCKIWECK